MMEIIYKLNEKISPEQLLKLFNDANLKRPQSLERLNKMINDADILISAWSENELIGVVRCITDYSFCCYISDLAIGKKFQKKGIGKELIRKVQEYLGDEVMILLLSVPQALNYYPKIGFNKIDNAYQIPRKA